MLYRENGQFKTSYAEDQQILPIVQDRWFMLALLTVAYFVLPVLASDYLFRALIIPFLILAIAAIGLNILVGYCGQISLGTAAFMSIGAYGAYNLVIRLPMLNFLVVLVLAGAIAAVVGVLFGIPSLRIKGLYLAVATLAAQFFIDWMFARVKWFTDYSPSGSVSTAPTRCTIASASNDPRLSRSARSCSRSSCSSAGTRGPPASSRPATSRFAVPASPRRVTSGTTSSASRASSSPTSCGRSSSPRRCSCSRSSAQWCSRAGAVRSSRSRPSPSSRARSAKS
jgi:hypothetical protein